MTRRAGRRYASCARTPSPLSTAASASSTRRPPSTWQHSSSSWPKNSPPPDMGQSTLEYLQHYLVNFFPPLSFTFSPLLFFFCYFSFFLFFLSIFSFLLLSCPPALFIGDCITISTFLSISLSVSSLFYKLSFTCYLTPLLFITHSHSIQSVKQTLKM